MDALELLRVKDTQWLVFLNICRVYCRTVWLQWKAGMWLFLVIIIYINITIHTLKMYKKRTSVENSHHQKASLQQLQL